MNWNKVVNKYSEMFSSTSVGFTKNPIPFGDYEDGFSPYITPGSDIVHIGGMSRRTPINLITSVNGDFKLISNLGVPSPYDKGNLISDFTIEPQFY